MAIRFNGAARASRTTGLFTNANSFSACGWAKIASGTTTGAIFKTNRAAAPAGQLFVGNLAGQTSISVVVNFGADGAYPAFTPGVGNWFFWAMTQNGTAVTVYFATAAATGWSASWTSSAGTSFVPDVIDVGGTAANEFFNGTTALVKVWNGVLTSSQLFNQKSQTAPITATGIVSSHLMDGPDVTADLVADTGGATANLTMSGSGATYDSSYPLSGTATIAVASATPSGSAITVSGTFTAGASPSIAVSLSAGASGTTQGPSAATIDGANWSIVFANVPPGVYTPTATVTDGSGAVSATGSTVEVIGLSGTGELPATYSVGSLSVTPESTSVSVSGTVVLTAKDGSGLPLAGVTFTSLAPSVATVTSPSDAAGQVTVTGVAAGTATVRGTYSDPSAGVLTDSSIIAVALLVPAAPTSLTAALLGTTAARLAWTDNASNETGFTLERATVSTGPWTPVATPGANVTTADDASVTPGTVYYYRVKAQNGDGSSGYSNVATLAIPATSDTTPPTITMTATTTNVTIANALTSLVVSAADDRGVTEVRFYRDGQQVGQMLTAPNNGELYVLVQQFVTSQDNGTYVYTARAWDAAGNSTLSAPVSVVVNIPVSTSVPTAPSNLTATLVTSSTALLQWSDNSNDESAFLLEQRFGLLGAWEQIQVLPANSVSHQLSGLLASTTYQYRLRAQGGGGASGYSNEVNVVTLAPGSTELQTLVASTSVLSDVPGVTTTVTYTAVNGNGSTRPGVTITPGLSVAGVATVQPANAVTDASGKASFTVTFGATVGQANLTVVASDGTTTLSGSATPVVTVFTLPSLTEQLVKELLAEQQDPKYADEIQPYVFDFSPYLGRGETISTILSVESVPTGGQDNDPQSAEMIFGAPRTVGTRVLQFFRDGLPGVSYYLRCRCRTSIGRVIISEIRIRVYRQTGARVSVSSPIVD